MINKKALIIAALPFIAAAVIFGVKAQKNETANSGRLDNNQIQSSASQVREFNVVAKKWSFEPAQITVNQGDKVRLNITSADAPHGLAIKEYGINQEIEPGQTATVEFTADQPGEFTFFCSVFCGDGHREQRGVLIVK